jgi:hypothetical protein
MMENALALGLLAAGIIPADDLDDGAACVAAGDRLAEKIAAGVNGELYHQGLNAAQTIAAERFGAELEQLVPDQLHELVGALRDAMPGFYKQLRMDVSAIYLSDPGVWQRIGFPGPSTASGGYPDFDQEQ